jgi:hypothetical protein
MMMRREWRITLAIVNLSVRVYMRPKPYKIPHPPQPIVSKLPRWVAYDIDPR